VYPHPGAPVRRPAHPADGRTPLRTVACPATQTIRPALSNTPLPAATTHRPAYRCNLTPIWRILYTAGHT